MNPRDIWILYSNEIRSALRERSIVVNSILMPIFLYPVLLWVMFSAMTFIQGLNEGFTSRIAVLGDLAAEHGSFLDSLGSRDNVELFRDVREDSAVSRVRGGDLDAVLTLRAPEGEGSRLPSNFVADVRYDSSEARSRNALLRIRRELEEYRAAWVQREAASLGMSSADQDLFSVTDENVSTEEDLGSLILGMIVPLFLSIMVALGCFFPAVDTTAGERERSTWETLMTTSASRASVVSAKYLYVATMGVFAGILNVLAIFVSIGAVISPLLAENEAITFRLPLMAVPVMMAGAVVLALLLSAGMMILASFARTFKDGQAMVQPVYFAAILIPLLLGQQTDQTLTASVASIPIANVAMMIRDAINGVFLWPYIVQSLIVNLLLVILCLAVARFILRFEDFLIGSFDGSFWRFAKDRFGPGRSQKETV